jgi:hypothetical protein
MAEVHLPIMAESALSPSVSTSSIPGGKSLPASTVNYLKVSAPESRRAPLHFHC